jgi:hypothetical protein
MYKSNRSPLERGLVGDTVGAVSGWDVQAAQEKQLR